MKSTVTQHPRQPRTQSAVSLGPGAIYGNPDLEHSEITVRSSYETAGVASEKDSRVVDFHAFCRTCLSWVADAGTPFGVLQDFARLSTPM